MTMASESNGDLRETRVLPEPFSNRPELRARKFAGTEGPNANLRPSDVKRELLIRWGSRINLPNDDSPLLALCIAIHCDKQGLELTIIPGTQLNGWGRSHETLLFLLPTKSTMTSAL
jgi:hypothetical protein